MPDVTLDLLFERLAKRGTGSYGLSDVSQLEHALQSAALARQSDSGDAFAIAALFRDVGHLLADEDIDLAAQGIDDRHGILTTDAAWTSASRVRVTFIKLSSRPNRKTIKFPLQSSVHLNAQVSFGKTPRSIASR